MGPNHTTETDTAGAEASFSGTLPPVGTRLFGANRQDRVAAIEAISEQRLSGEPRAPLRQLVTRSLAVPQRGDYHNEGPFQDSHLGLMMDTATSLRTGLCAPELPPAVAELIVDTAIREQVALDHFILLHDGRKADCLTLFRGQKAIVLTWDQWQQFLLRSGELGERAFAGDGSALATLLENKRIDRISYFQERKNLFRQHGPLMADELAASGVIRDEDLIDVIRIHEGAFRFQTVSATGWDELTANMSDRASALFLTAAYIDLWSSHRPGGVPDPIPYLNVCTSWLRSKTLRDAVNLLAGGDRKEQVSEAFSALATGGGDKKLLEVLEYVAATHRPHLDKGKIFPQIMAARTDTSGNASYTDPALLYAQLVSKSKFPNYDASLVSKDPQVQKLLGPDDMNTLLRLIREEPNKILRSFGPKTAKLKALLAPYILQ